MYFMVPLLLCIRLVANAENIPVYMDGEEVIFDTQPFIENGRTLVPMRAIFEKYGARVDWDDDTNTVTAYTKGMILSMDINNTTIFKNTLPEETDVPAILRDGRTYVPLRLVAETLNSDVVWDDKTKSVFITRKENNYLDWNSSYDYYGQIENSEANGYGGLYNKSTGELTQLGFYEDSEIVADTNYYDDSMIYTGEFANSKMNGTGMLAFTDGAIYSGNFVDNVMEGEGTLAYPDGSYYSGNWKSGSLQGNGIFYDAQNKLQYEGVFVSGKREGAFTVKDLTENTSEVVSFHNDVYVTEDYFIRMEYENLKAEYEKKSSEIDKQIAALLEEEPKLLDEYREELEKLNDYIANGDPFSTDWAKTIYKQYSIDIDEEEPKGTDFASSNAKRIWAYNKSLADRDILAFNETYIDKWGNAIKNEYESKMKQINSTMESLQIQLNALETSYKNSLKQLEIKYSIIGH